MPVQVLVGGTDWTHLKDGRGWVKIFSFEVHARAFNSSWFFFQNAWRLYINITCNVNFLCTLNRNMYKTKPLALCFSMEHLPKLRFQTASPAPHKLIGPGRADQKQSSIEGIFQKHLIYRCRKQKRKETQIAYLSPLPTIRSR